MSDIPAERGQPRTVDEQDENRLAQFGYKQELRRDWGLAHNFGVSFSIIVSLAALSSDTLNEWLTHTTLRASSLVSPLSSPMGMF